MKRELNLHLYTPLTNLLWDSTEAVQRKISDEMCAMYSHLRSQYLPGEAAVTYHQRVLGKQTYTYMGSSKFWVWNFKTYRVYAAKKGIGSSFEVLASLPLTEVITAWHEYLAKIGMLV